MKLLSMVALLVLYSAFCLADSRTIRNSDGTTRGTITRSGDNETIRNEHGEIVYTGERSGRSWEYRNADGEAVWSEDDD